MFLEEKFHPSEHPYVAWDVAGELSMDKNQASSPLIQSKVLFPLGLVLVELSLCWNLESLRTQEDADSLEAVANLKTAAQYLPAVEMESGLRYSQVVKRCLFSSDTVDMMSEDESVQETVFEYVIAPLVQNLRDFDGLFWWTILHPLLSRWVYVKYPAALSFLLPRMVVLTPFLN